MPWLHKYLTKQNLAQHHEHGNQQKACVLWSTLPGMYRIIQADPFGRLLLWKSEFGVEFSTVRYYPNRTEPNRKPNRTEPKPNRQKNRKLQGVFSVRSLIYSKSSLSILQSPVSTVHVCDLIDKVDEAFWNAMNNSGSNHRFQEFYSYFCRTKITILN